MSRALILTATSALFFTSPAIAQDVWTFNGANGPLADTATFLSMPNGIPVVASGFGPGGPVGLFQKNAGADEVGLGLQNDPAGLNEISFGSFVQLSLLPGVNIMTVSLGTSSTTNGEQWGLSLSNTAGSLGTIFLTGTSSQVVNFNSGGAAFLDVTELTPGIGNGVLVSEMNEPSGIAPIIEIPEPASLSLYAMMALLAVALGRIFRRV